MKVEKDYVRHSYKMEYVIGLEMITTYIDFKCSQIEYDEWVNRHRQYIRNRILDILTFET